MWSVGLKNVGVAGMRGNVSWQEFVAAIVDAIAWPVVVLTGIVLFRSAIASALRGDLKRLRFGPVEAEWERRIAEARDQVPEEVQETAEAGVAGSLTDELSEVARIAPAAAVVEAYARVERTLRRLGRKRGVLLHPGGQYVSAWRMAKILHEANEISDQVLYSIEDLTTLRNLAAHGEAGDLDEKRALDYVELAGTVLFLLGERQLADEYPADDGATGVRD
jgi:hypothetical protein